MITAFPLSQENMIGFTIDGDIDEEGMSRLLLALEAKVAAHDRVRLLGNIKQIGGLDSFQQFIKLLRAKADLWGKVEKYAILTDYGWLSSLTNAADWLTTRMEVRTFPLSDGERAHQWLRLDPLTPDPSRSEGFRELELGPPHVLAIAVRDRLHPDDHERLALLVAKKVADHGQAKLLIDLRDFEGTTIKGVYEDLTASARIFPSLERVAFVGDQSWLKAGIKVSDLLTPGLEMAAFPSTELRRAVGWLD